MSTLNKSLCLAVLLLTEAPLAHALRANTATDPLQLPEGKINVTAQGGYGIVNGTANEIVYETIEGVGTRKLSELVWDLSQLQMIGVGLSIDFDHSFKVSGSYWKSVNKGNGQMEDYDWLSYDRPFAWTHYSRSQVDVTQAHVYDICLSVPLLFKDNTSLSAVIGYKDDFWKWSDHAMEYVYSSEYGFRDLQGSFGGTNMIVYQQSFTFPYAGIEGTYVNDKYSFNFYATFSNAVKSEDKDRHIARKVTFIEKFSDGTYIGAGVAASYKATELFQVGLKLDYQEIPEIRGDMKIIPDEGEVEEYENNAAISHTSTMFSAFLEMRF